jgi:hypothetical protein
LLANIYLHYVFDVWVRQWRRQRANGDVVVVRGRACDQIVTIPDRLGRRHESRNVA